MENTGNWIVLVGWLGVGAVFTNHYKTGLACFVTVFALCMLSPTPFGPGQAAAVAGVAWFVGLPALLTWAMPVLGPVLVIVGAFVVAGWLFPKKAG